MITTVSTVTTITALEFTGAINIAMGVLLMLFLATRELAGANNTGLSLRIAKFASVDILPLVVVFAVIVLQEIFEVLA
ncbi:hypothetical protein ACFLX8_01700 [Chloroflexota bacterium]